MKTFENFEKHWNRLSQFGIWIVALITGLIFKPELYEFQNEWLPGFLQFICSILAGILLVLTRKYNTNNYTKSWLIVATFAFLATILLTAKYTYDFDQYTVDYADSKTVVGEKDNLIIEAKVRLKVLEANTKGRHLTIKEIVSKTGGATETLWDIKLLRNRRFILLTEYAAFFFIITILIISLLQAIESQNNKKRISK